MIMSEQDREVATALRNEWLTSLGARRVKLIIGLSAARSLAELLEDEIGERGGDVFEASVCKCQPDRGVTCLLCLAASRLRIMAREFEARNENELAGALFNLSARMDGASA